MKNSIKIQTEIMKHIKKYNEDKALRNAVYTEIDIDDRKIIIVALKGYTGYYFNSDEFYIDKSKMTEVAGLKKFYDELKNQEPIEPTGVIKQFITGNAVEFENKNFKVYVDEKLIKEFGKVEDLWFVGKGEVKPVYVYEGENLVGMIMPILPTRLKNKD